MSGGSESNGANGDDRAAGDGRGGGAAVAQPIPGSARKMIQNVKEIVTNFADHEIYAMLKDCNMNPDEAVQRLLSLDTFHEVKSKRERRKEMKETHQSRSHVVSNGSYHASKGSNEHNTRYGASGQTYSGEYEKPAYKREIGSLAPSIPGLASSNFQMAAANQLSVSHSGFFNPGHKTWEMGSSDAFSSSAQTSAPMGPPGHVSMADVVKMGRPPGNVSSAEYMLPETSYLSHAAITPHSSDCHEKHSHGYGSPSLESSRDLHSQDPFGTSEDCLRGGWHAVSDEWSVSEHLAAANPSSGLSKGADSSPHSYFSNWHSDIGHSSNRRTNELEVPQGNLSVGRLDKESIDVKNPASTMGSAAGVASSRHAIGQSKDHCAPSPGDISAAISSTAVNLQQLSLRRERRVENHLEDKSAPVIPSHLQVSAAELSHLSFGSYKPRNGSSTRSLSSNGTNNDYVAASSIARNSSLASHHDTRSVGHHGGEQLRSNFDSNRLGIDARMHDLLLNSPHDLVDRPSHLSTYETQNLYEASIPNRSFEINQHWESALPYSQVKSKFEDLNRSEAYPRSDSLASSVQSFRQADPYSSFLATQLMHSKDSAGLASCTAVMQQKDPVSQSSLLKLHDNGSGRAVSKNYAFPSYSQALPLDPLTDNTDYPFLDESLGCRPGYDQSYSDMSHFDEFQASSGKKFTLQQLKSNVSISSSLPFSSNSSTYGSYGGSVNLRENFAQNPAFIPTANSLVSENILNSLYDSGHRMIPFEQDGNYAAWLHEPGSRTAPSVQATSHYSFEGKSQQHIVYQDAPQTLEHFDTFSYPNNIHHPHLGIMREQQMQGPCEPTFPGTQSKSAMQANQIWQRSY